MSFSEQQLKNTQVQDLNVKRLHNILPQVSWLPSKRNPNTYHTIFSDARDAHTFKSKLQSAITKYKLPLTVIINKTKTAPPVVSLSGVTAESLLLLAKHQSHCNSINFEPIWLTSVKKARLISELNEGNLDSCNIILADITQLSIINELTETGLKTLVEVLKGNNTLTSLDLGGNNIGAAGVKDLADALKTNTTLTSLDLWENNISDAGAKELADALKANTTLTSLSLKSNNISDAGAKELADALKANNTLTLLSLGDNNIGAAGAKDLADALKANTTLTSLYLWNNNISDAGAKDLADALKANTTLTLLNLRDNNIGAAGAKDLAEALEENATLIELDLGKNDFSDQQISLIEVSTTRNNTFEPNIELVSRQLLQLLLTVISNIPTVIAPLILDYAQGFNVAMMKSFTKGSVQNMTFPASIKPSFAEVVEDDEDYDHKKNPPLSQSRVSIATSSSSFHYHSPAKLASSTSSSSDLEPSLSYD